MRKHVITFPNLPAIPTDDPAQAAKNLRAVAERMLRAAQDIDALTDASKYDNARPYVIAEERDGEWPGTREIVMSRDDRAIHASEIDLDDPADYVGRKLPNLYAGYDSGRYIIVTELSPDGEYGTVAWFNEDGTPDHESSCGSFGPDSLLRTAADVHNMKAQSARLFRNGQYR